MVVLDRETLSFVKILMIDLGTAKVYLEGLEDQLQTNVGTDWYQAPEVASGQAYGMAADMYSIGQTLKVTFLGFWTNPEVRDRYFSDDNSKIVWYREWNLEQAICGLETNHLVQKILKLTKKDPQERPLLDEALQLFWNIPGETNEQSQDFKLAVRKILNVVNLGFLCEDFENLDEERTKISKERTKISKFYETVSEATKTLEDAGNEVSGTVIDDDSTDGE